jgi:hypothetical protein
MLSDSRCDSTLEPSVTWIMTRSVIRSAEPCVSGEASCRDVKRAFVVGRELTSRSTKRETAHIVEHAQIPAFTQLESVTNTVSRVKSQIESLSRKAAILGLLQGKGLQFGLMIQRFTMSISGTCIEGTRCSRNVEHAMGHCSRRQMSRGVSYQPPLPKWLHRTVVRPDCQSDRGSSAEEFSHRWRGQTSRRRYLWGDREFRVIYVTAQGRAEVVRALHKHLAWYHHRPDSKGSSVGSSSRIVLIRLAAWKTCLTKCL